MHIIESVSFLFDMLVNGYDKCQLACQVMHACISGSFILSPHCICYVYLLLVFLSCICKMYLKACCILQMLKYIQKLHAKGTNVAAEVAELFAGELNPVAPKAQRKVPVPDGYVCFR